LVKFALLFIAALAPAAFLLHYFYVRDKYARESLRLVLTVYALSYLSLLPAVLFELPVNLLRIGPPGSITVALIEEAMKLLFLRWLVLGRREFDEPYDGILYGVTVGLGFASAENLLYVLSSGSLPLAFVRGVLSVPAHCVWGVIMGFYLSRWKFEADETKRPRLLWLALVLPAAPHAIYDGSILLASSTSNISALVLFVVLIGQWVFARRLVRTAQAASDFQHPSPILAPV